MKILSFFKDTLQKAYVNKKNRKKLIKKYGLKNGVPVIDFLEIFPSYNEIIKPLSFMPGGSSSVTDYALLLGFARKFEKCRYLEIGTWRGESIACVASVAEECISISFSNEQMRDMGLSDEVIKNSRFFSVAPLMLSAAFPLSDNPPLLSKSDFPFFSTRATSLRSASFPEIILSKFITSRSVGCGI